MRVCMFNILILYAISSCDNSNVRTEDYEKLELENLALRQENKILNDSLSEYNEKLIRSQILVGIPDDEDVKVGESNNIQVLFHPFNIEVPQYEIYKVEGSKEIKLGSSNKTKFNYEFIPKSVKDNKIDLKIKIPFKNDTIEIPAGMIFKVKD